MPSLLQLPQNIWRDNVVCFLPKVKDLARLDSAVTNRNDRVTFHSNISGCKRFIRYDDCSRNGKLQWFAVRNVRVNVVRLSEEPRMEDIPYIKQLLLHAGCLRFSKKVLSRTSDVLYWACSATLETISLQNCNVVDISGLSACSNLAELEIYDCPYLTEESFVKAIGGCAKLIDCYVHNCTNLRAATIVALLVSCAQVREMNLIGHFDLQQAFAQFRSVSNLKKFTCSNPYRAVCLTGVALQGMVTVLPLLTHLELGYQYSTVADEDIEVLARGWKFLTFMKLPRLPHVTNTGVIALTRALSQLGTLYLSHLAITDAAVQAVGTHCRVLQSLNINDCPLLTDAAFSTLNVACLRIVSLNDTRITGTIASYLLSPQSALREFYCFVGEQLNDDFVHCLTRNTTVTTLGLGKNLLTEADWSELSIKFPNLTELYLRNAALVNDAIALSFYKHCPELRAFVITDCNVSSEVMEQVKT